MFRLSHSHKAGKIRKGSYKICSIETQGVQQCNEGYRRLSALGNILGVSSLEFRVLIHRNPKTSLQQTGHNKIDNQLLELLQ